MDLREFVSEALTQIVGGVEDARARIKEINSEARVNPIWTTAAPGSEGRHGAAEPVEFDVAVVVADESTQETGSSVKASVGILSVVTAKMSGQMQANEIGERRNQTTSRVKFSVSLAQPADLKTTKRST